MYLINVLSQILKYVNILKKLNISIFQLKEYENQVFSQDFFS